MTTAKEALAKKKVESVAKESPASGMHLLMERMAGEIKRALPKQIDSERFQRVVLTAFSNNPKLQHCDPVSFLAAMMQSAQLGLEPNTPLGQAYLIPYGNQVQFQLGYKGLIDLATRTGQYQSVYAHAVHENDEFDIDYGLNQKLTHKPSMTGDRGPVIGYYAVYKLTNGGYGFAFSTKEEIESHGKKFSKTFNNGPWKTDFDAMAKKTVIKMALKYAPLSIEQSDMKKAVSIDEQVVSTPKGKETIEASWSVSENVDEETGEILDGENGFFGPDFKPVDGIEDK